MPLDEPGFEKVGLAYFSISILFLASLLETFKQLERTQAYNLYQTPCFVL